VSTCAAPPAKGRRSSLAAPARPSANPSRSLTPDEEWARRQAENKGFRDHGPLQPAAAAGSAPCVEAVRKGLQRLRAASRYDAKAILGVLNGIGLTEVQARPAGRLDRAGHGGLLFAGWTGQACVIGEHGKAITEVNLGSRTADGGCLPAPD
jgi:hypothetical protein